tara:strand:+ start:346 stop:732 length:387 start_codon:yes stop_codon:yes gene_type:complete
MCFGKPKAPNIVYQGPSAEDIARDQANLKTFQETTAANTKTFQDSINKQITAAQSSTADLLAQMKTAQAGVQNVVNDAPYAITTEDNVTPEDAKTTEKISKKKKKPSTLKISAGGLKSSSGTGVNYGV